MLTSNRLVQTTAVLQSVVAGVSVADLPQLIDRRNTKFDPDLVLMSCLVVHKLSPRCIELDCKLEVMK